MSVAMNVDWDRYDFLRDAQLVRPLSADERTEWNTFCVVVNELDQEELQRGIAALGRLCSRHEEALQRLRELTASVKNFADNQEREQ